METPKDGKRLVPNKANNRYGVAELNELIKANKINKINYPCGNRDALLDMIGVFAQTELGIPFLIKQNRDTRQRCFNLIFDDEVNETQKVRQLLTIAKLDMVIDALIWVIGNQKIPALKDWTPTLGMRWQQRASVLISNKQWDSAFWLDSYRTMVQDRVDQSETVVSKHGDVELPIQAVAIKDVSLEIHKNLLAIDINGDMKYFQWNELEWFWDKRGNQRGVNAEILLELTRDLDNCLKADSQVNHIFGKKRDPQKQIHSLAKALDKTVFVADKLELKATKRWFHRTDKYGEPRWKPLFRFNSGGLSEVNQMAKEFAEENATVNEMADKILNNNDSKLSVDEMISEGIFRHNIKNEQVSNEYQNENVGIEEVWVDKK